MDPPAAEGHAGDLDQYVKPDMPPLYYALCGCEDLPGFPQKWGGK